jgi:hypothetical protein
MFLVCIDCVVFIIYKSFLNVLIYINDIYVQLVT